MLYYKEDKLLSRPFLRVWTAMESLLTLARPGTAEPEAVTVWDSRAGKTRERHAVVDETGNRNAVRQLYEEARLLSQHPEVRIYIRWNPAFGPRPVTYDRDDLSRQLAIVEQPVYHNTWVFLYLLTSFETAGDEFEQFLNAAHSLLPFKLLPQHWRVVGFTKAGKARLRKLVTQKRA